MENIGSDVNEDEGLFCHKDLIYKIHLQRQAIKKKV